MTPNPKTIRYWTTYSITDSGWWTDLFRLPPDRFRLVFDERSPDYLFVTENIYHSPEAYLDFLEQNHPERVTVFYALEAVYPDMNLFDYAVVHDPSYSLGDRVAKLPLLSFYHRSLFPGFGRPPEDPHYELMSKTGFCSFLYSNPAAHPRRDAIFRALSSYKPVASLGKHLNNQGNPDSRATADWRELSIEIKKPFKFSIAAENARHPGYITEKILTSFQARSVPIYWGDPACETVLNPGAFVNANDLSDEKLVETIRNIDTNDDLWMKMVSSPPLTPAQQEAQRIGELHFQSFSENIFEQSLAEAKRIPAGTWADFYSASFLQRKSFAKRAVWIRTMRHQARKVLKAFSI